MGRGKGNLTNTGVTYGEYLKVEELLSLQKPLSSPVAHDELLFITIHQVYELWFKQALFELDSAISFIGQDKLLPAFHRIERVHEIFRILIQQVDILETMTPVEFNRFRARLNPASGFQSWQFRELELLSGADISEYAKFTALDPEWGERLEARGRKMSMRSAFFALLERNRLITDLSAASVGAAIVAIYAKPQHDELQMLCEHLIRYDEQIQLWRFRHVQMVERMIGMKMGTGGSLGVSYLQSTLQKRYFPELWQARTQMGQSEGVLIASFLPPGSGGGKAQPELFENRPKSQDSKKGLIPSPGFDDDP